MTPMRSDLLKLLIVGFFFAVFALYGLNGSPVGAFSSGPPPSLTGAPGEATCAQCHGGGPTGGTLTLTGLPANYIPNQEVTLTVTLTQSNRARFGFQLTAIDDTGKRAGDLIPDDNRTQTLTNAVSGNNRQYINHTLAGSNPSSTGVGSWSFKWKAPAQSVGRVTFYVAGNAANGNGSPTGDAIYTINQSIQPGSSTSPLASVSAASFVPNAPLSSDSIAAAFGANLSPNTVAATTVPLPTELDGTQVIVRDATGDEVNASLFFVSPGQINYHIPIGRSDGRATVTVRRGAADVAQGALQIEQVASPGLFSANANGQDVAAAVVLLIRANGEQTFEPVAQFNTTTNRFEAAPIDLGPDTDQVFLILFGTGFRGRSSLSDVNCAIGGTNTEVLFAGAQPNFIGLDQANVRIPRSLLGRGNVDVVFMVGNRTANTVTINIR